MSTVAGLALWLLAARDAPAAPVAVAPPATPPAAKAVEPGRFPWYDSASGKVKPILPWPDLNWTYKGSRLERFVNWWKRTLAPVGRWFRWMNRWKIPGLAGLGDVVAIGLALMLLAVVLVALIELIRRYAPVAPESPGAARPAAAGKASRIEGMPAGVAAHSDDPWAEAVRRRNAGDLDGAVVYLFAYMLRTLAKSGRLRLVPGRTGRQLVRSVADRPLRELVDPTLRLFEAVYYGQRSPTRGAFDDAWTRAEAFARRFAAGDAG